MFMRVILTLLLAAMIAVAVKLWMPERAPADPTPSASELLLLKPVRDLDLRGVTREQAVKMLEAKTGTTLVVDWASMSLYGREEPAYRAVKLDAYLTSVPLATALKVVLGYRATWQVEGSVISVAGVEAMDLNQMTVHAYDVSDLASDDDWGVKTPVSEAAGVEAARMERVRDVLIQHTPGLGWHINYNGSGTPGGNASVSVCGNSLIVTETTQGHAEISKILTELRQRSEPRSK